MTEQEKRVLKKKLEHKIARCDEKITFYEDLEGRLSPHGHRSLGYFEGRKSVLEDMLDEVCGTGKPYYFKEE